MRAPVNKTSKGVRGGLDNDLGHLRLVIVRHVRPGGCHRHIGTVGQVATGLEPPLTRSNIPTMWHGVLALLCLLGNVVYFFVSVADAANQLSQRRSRTGGLITNVWLD